MKENGTRLLTSKEAKRCPDFTGDMMAANQETDPNINLTQNKNSHQGLSILPRNRLPHKNSGFLRDSTGAACYLCLLTRLNALPRAFLPGARTAAAASF